MIQLIALCDTSILYRPYCADEAKRANLYPATLTFRRRHFCHTIGPIEEPVAENAANQEDGRHRGDNNRVAVGASSLDDGKGGGGDLRLAKPERALGVLPEALRPLRFG